jgi:hypothetical protein
MPDTPELSTVALKPMRKCVTVAECEVYAAPMRIIHAALLMLGVLAIAIAAEIMFAGGAVFWIAGILATLALLPDAPLFSFMMTESVTFSLYSIAALALVDAVSPLSVVKTTMHRAGGAFRSRRKWYQFSFTCRSSADT